MTLSQKNRGLRTVAFATVIAFAVTTVGGDSAWAASGVEMAAVRISETPLGSLPPALGRVLSYQQTSQGNNAPFILHIQDAHSNPPAQKNIAKLLEWISQQSQGRQLLIALEGVKGRLHPEYLNFFPNHPKVTQALIQQLAEKGELTGAELFAWKTSRTASGVKRPASSGIEEAKAVFVGVEEPVLYRENLSIYREFLEHETQIKTELSRLRRELHQRENNTLSKEAREYLREKRRRKEGEYQTGHNNPQWEVYLGYLKKKLKEKVAFDLESSFEQIRFPNMVRLEVLIRAFKDLDLTKAEKEKETFLKQLENKIRTAQDKQILTAFRERSNSVNLRGYAEQVWALARSYQMNPKIAAEFWRMTGRDILQAELDVSGLDQEMSQLEGWLEGALADSKEAKKIFKWGHDFERLEKLLSLELTAGEMEGGGQKAEGGREKGAGSEAFFQEVLTSIPRFAELSSGLSDLSSSRRRGSKSMDSRLFGNDKTKRDMKKFLKTWVGKAQQFYGLAIQRDKILLDNTLAAAQGKKTAVLITGGFHTDGFIELLRSRGLGYAVIQPQMDASGEDFYRKVLSGENADVSAYFEKPFLNKQEALFFKTIVETGAAELWEKEKVPHQELAAETSEALRTHPVLKDRLEARAVPEGKQGSRLELRSTESRRRPGLAGAWPRGSAAVVPTLVTNGIRSFERLDPGYKGVRAAALKTRVSYQPAGTAVLVKPQLALQRPRNVKKTAPHARSEVRSVLFGDVSPEVMQQSPEFRRFSFDHEHDVALTGRGPHSLADREERILTLILKASESMINFAQSQAELNFVIMMHSLPGKHLRLQFVETPTGLFESQGSARAELAFPNEILKILVPVRARDGKDLFSDEERAVISVYEAALVLTKQQGVSAEEAEEAAWRLARKYSIFYFSRPTAVQDKYEALRRDIVEAGEAQTFITRKQVGSRWIDLVEGDLSLQHADALVNPSNPGLQIGIGVGSHLVRRGGNEIADEAAQKAPILPGEAVSTGAGSLNARYVIHAAVSDQLLTADLEVIRRATQNVLREADRLQLKTIAFPSFGTGTIGIPLAESAKVMFEVIEAHLLESTTSLENVTLVLYGPEAFRAYSQVLAQRQRSEVRAFNEAWQGKSYRALVELSGRGRQLGTVRLEGAAGSNHIEAVYFRKAGQSQEVQLEPVAVKFVLSAYVLGWGDTAPRALLAEQYTKDADLRHIFAFPFVENQAVFYAELLSGDAEGRLAKAFARQPLDLSLAAVPDLDKLSEQLTRYGYQKKDSAPEVQVPGDYFIQDTLIRLIFLPAVYPVNALAVSLDGKQTALVTVPGRSGRLGANYETVFTWAREQIQSAFGWQPYALFALDNGMDPTMIRNPLSADQKEVVIDGGRGSNAALNVLGGKSQIISVETPVAAERSEVRANVVERSEMRTRQGFQAWLDGTDRYREERRALQFFLYIALTTDQKGNNSYRMGNTPYHNYYETLQKIFSHKSEGERKETIRRVTGAFFNTPRHLFTLSYPDQQEEAYTDMALRYSQGQTIPQPSLMAFMLAALDLKTTDRVLEIGAGSGWLAAWMSLLAQHVDAVESLPALVQQARRNIELSLRAHLVDILEGDGWKGAPERAPYDVIILSADAQEKPEHLFEQLSPNGGRMMAPVKGVLKLYVKKGSEMEEQDLLEKVNFESLVHPPKKVMEVANQLWKRLDDEGTREAAFQDLLIQIDGFGAVGETSGVNVLAASLARWISAGYVEQYAPDFLNLLANPDEFARAVTVDALARPKVMDQTDLFLPALATLAQSDQSLMVRETAIRGLARRSAEDEKLLAYAAVAAVLKENSPYLAPLRDIFSDAALIPPLLAHYWTSRLEKVGAIKSGPEFQEIIKNFLQTLDKKILVASVVTELLRLPNESPEQETLSTLYYALVDSAQEDQWLPTLMDLITASSPVLPDMSRDEKDMLHHRRHFFILGLVPLFESGARPTPEQVQTLLKLVDSDPDFQIRAVTAMALLSIKDPSIDAQLEAQRPVLQIYRSLESNAWTELLSWVQEHGIDQKITAVLYHATGLSAQSTFDNFKTRIKKDIRIALPALFLLVHHDQPWMEDLRAEILRLFATASFEDRAVILALMDMRKGQPAPRPWTIPEREIHLHNDAVSELILSADGQYLISAGKDGKVFRSRVDTGKPEGEPVNYEGSIYAVHADSDGSLWVVVNAPAKTPGGAPDSMQLLRIENPFEAGQKLAQVQTIELRREWADAFLLGEARMIFSPDGQLAAYFVAESSSVFMFKPKEMLQKGRLDADALAFHPGKKWLGLGAETDVFFAVHAVAHPLDGDSPKKPDTIQVRQFSGDMMGTMPVVWSTAAPSSGVRALVFNPDSSKEQLLILDKQGGMVLSDMRTGKTAAIPGLTTAKTAVFSPDGGVFATAEQDGRVVVWDTQRGEPMAVFVDHTQPAETLAFSSDGRWLYSASPVNVFKHDNRGYWIHDDHRDKTIRKWDLVAAEKRYQTAEGDAARDDLFQWEVDLQNGKKMHLDGDFERRVNAARKLHQTGKLIPEAVLKEFSNLPTLGARQTALMAVYLYRVGLGPYPTLDSVRAIIQTLQILEDTAIAENEKHFLSGGKHRIALEAHSNIAQKKGAAFEAKAHTVKNLLELAMRVSGNIDANGELRVRALFEDGGLEHQSLPFASPHALGLYRKVLAELGTAEDFHPFGEHLPSHRTDRYDYRAMWSHFNFNGPLDGEEAFQMTLRWLDFNARLARREADAQLLRPGYSGKYIGQEIRPRKESSLETERKYRSEAVGHALVSKKPVPQMPNPWVAAGSENLSHENLALPDFENLAVLLSEMVLLYQNRSQWEEEDFRRWIELTADLPDIAPLMEETRRNLKLNASKTLIDDERVREHEDRLRAFHDQRAGALPAAAVLPAAEGRVLHLAEALQLLEKEQGPEKAVHAIALKAEGIFFLNSRGGWVSFDHAAAPPDLMKWLAQRDLTLVVEAPELLPGTQSLSVSRERRRGARRRDRPPVIKASDRQTGETANLDFVLSPEQLTRMIPERINTKDWKDKKIVFRDKDNRVEGFVLNALPDSDPNSEMAKPLSVRLTPVRTRSEVRGRQGSWAEEVAQRMGVSSFSTKTPAQLQTGLQSIREKFQADRAALDFPSASDLKYVTVLLSNAALQFADPAVMTGVFEILALMGADALNQEPVLQAALRTVKNYKQRTISVRIAALRVIQAAELKNPKKYLSDMISILKSEKEPDDIKMEILKTLEGWGDKAQPAVDSIAKLLLAEKSTQRLRQGATAALEVLAPKQLAALRRAELLGQRGSQRPPVTRMTELHFESTEQALDVLLHERSRPAIQAQRAREYLAEQPASPELDHALVSLIWNQASSRATRVFALAFFAQTAMEPTKAEKIIFDFIQDSAIHADLIKPALGSFLSLSQRLDGAPAALSQAILTLLQSPDAEVQKVMLQKLKQFPYEAPEVVLSEEQREALVPQVVLLLSTSPSSDVRLEAAKILGEYAPVLHERSVPVLIQTLDYPRESVVKAAARSLGAFGVHAVSAKDALERAYVNYRGRPDMEAVIDASLASITGGQRSEVRAMSFEGEDGAEDMPDLTAWLAESLPEKTFRKDGFVTRRLNSQTDEPRTAADLDEALVRLTPSAAHTSLLVARAFKDTRFEDHAILNYGIYQRPQGPELFITGGRFFVQRPLEHEGLIPLMVLWILNQHKAQFQEVHLGRLGIVEDRIFMEQKANVKLAYLLRDLGILDLKIDQERHKAQSTIHWEQVSLLAESPERRRSFAQSAARRERLDEDLRRSLRIAPLVQEDTEPRGKVVGWQLTLGEETLTIHDFNELERFLLTAGYQISPEAVVDMKRWEDGLAKTLPVLDMANPAANLMSEETIYGAIKKAVRDSTLIGGVSWGAFWVLSERFLNPKEVLQENDWDTTQEQLSGEQLYQLEARLRAQSHLYEVLLEDRLETNRLIEILTERARRLGQIRDLRSEVRATRRSRAQLSQMHQRAGEVIEAAWAPFQALLVEAGVPENDEVAEEFFAAYTSVVGDRFLGSEQNTPQATAAQAFRGYRAYQSYLEKGVSEVTTLLESDQPIFDTLAPVRTEQIIVAPDRSQLEENILGIVSQDGRNIERKIIVEMQTETGQKIVIILLEFVTAEKKPLGGFDGFKLEKAVLKQMMDTSALSKEVMLEGRESNGHGVQVGSAAILKGFGYGLTDVVYDIYAQLPIGLANGALEKAKGRLVREDQARLRSVIDDRLIPLIEGLHPTLEILEDQVEPILNFLQELEQQVLTMGDDYRGGDKGRVFRPSSVSRFLELLNARAEASSLPAKALEPIEQIMTQALQERFFIFDPQRVADERDQRQAIDQEIARFRASAEAAFREIENPSNGRKLSRTILDLLTFVRENILQEIETTIARKSWVADEVMTQYILAEKRKAKDLEEQAKNDSSYLSLAQKRTANVQDLEAIFTSIILKMRGGYHQLRGEIQRPKDTGKMVLFARQINIFDLIHFFEAFEGQTLAIISDDPEATRGAHWVQMARNDFGVETLLLPAGTLDAVFSTSLVGESVAVNMDQLQLYVRPSDETRAILQEQQADFEALRRYADVKAREPAVTQQGLKVLVRVSAERPEGIQDAMERGADGGGLAKTEFMIEGEELEAWLKDPSEDNREKLIEFFRVQFSSILESADYGLDEASRMITIRAYDFERDKNFGLPNPEGHFGPDYYRTEKGRELLKIELIAKLRASRPFSPGRLRVLFPAFRAPADLAALIVKERLVADGVAPLDINHFMAMAKSDPEFIHKSVAGLTGGAQEQLNALAHETPDFISEILKNVSSTEQDNLNRLAREDVDFMKRVFNEALEEARQEAIEAQQPLVRPALGFMIETLEGNHILPYLLEESDFVMYGTTDFIISTFRHLPGISRDNPVHSALFNQLQPEVMEGFKKGLDMTAQFNREHGTQHSLEFGGLLADSSDPFLLALIKMMPPGQTPIISRSPQDIAVTRLLVRDIHEGSETENEAQLVLKDIRERWLALPEVMALRDQIQQERVLAQAESLAENEAHESPSSDGGRGAVMIKTPIIHGPHPAEEEGLFKESRFFRLGQGTKFHFRVFTPLKAVREQFPAISFFIIHSDGRRANLRDVMDVTDLNLRQGKDIFRIELLGSDPEQFEAAYAALADKNRVYDFEDDPVTGEAKSRDEDKLQLLTPEPSETVSQGITAQALVDSLMAGAPVYREVSQSDQARSYTMVHQGEEYLLEITANVIDVSQTVSGEQLQIAADESAYTTLSLGIDDFVVDRPGKTEEPEITAQSIIASLMNENVTVSIERPQEGQTEAYKMVDQGTTYVLGISPSGMSVAREVKGVLQTVLTIPAGTADYLLLAGNINDFARSEQRQVAKTLASADSPESARSEQRQVAKTLASADSPESARSEVRRALQPQGEMDLGLSELKTTLDRSPSTPKTRADVLEAVRKLGIGVEPLTDAKRYMAEQAGHVYASPETIAEDLNLPLLEVYGRLIRLWVEDSGDDETQRAKVLEVIMRHLGDAAKILEGGADVNYRYFDFVDVSDLNEETAYALAILSVVRPRGDHIKLYVSGDEALVLERMGFVTEAYYAILAKLGTSGRANLEMMNSSGWDNTAIQKDMLAFSTGKNDKLQAAFISDNELFLNGIPVMKNGLRLNRRHVDRAQALLASPALLDAQALDERTLDVLQMREELERLGLGALLSEHFAQMIAEIKLLAASA